LSASRQALPRRDYARKNQKSPVVRKIRQTNDF
jgi:hypothetical protein